MPALIVGGSIVTVDVLPEPLRGSIAILLNVCQPLSFLNLVLPPLFFPNFPLLLRRTFHLPGLLRNRLLTVLLQTVLLQTVLRVARKGQSQLMDRATLCWTGPGPGSGCQFGNFPSAGRKTVNKSPADPRLTVSKFPGTAVRAADRCLVNNPAESVAIAG